MINKEQVLAAAINGLNHYDKNKGFGRSTWKGDQKDIAKIREWVNNKGDNSIGDLYKILCQASPETNSLSFNVINTIRKEFDWLNTPKYINAVKNSKNAEALCKILVEPGYDDFKDSEFYESIMDVICKHNQPYLAHEIIGLLKTNKILNQTNLELLSKSSQTLSSEQADYIRWSSRKQILDDNMFHLVLLNHNVPFIHDMLESIQFSTWKDKDRYKDKAGLYVALDKAKPSLLSKENVEKCYAIHFRDAILILSILNSAEVTTQTNFQQVFNKLENFNNDGEFASAYWLQEMLKQLKNYNSLNKDNLNLLLTNFNPSLANFLPMVSHELNSTENIAKFMRIIHYFSNQDVSNALNRLPHHLMNEDVFNQLYEIIAADLTSPTPRYGVVAERVRGLVNQLLPPVIAPQVQLNYGQSTHNTFVEKSASDSAVRLRDHYSDKIKNNLHNIISEISDWAESLGDTPKEKAAKTGIKKIIQPDYAYTEPRSGVTTYQLIALAWLAIHDDLLRNKNCTLDEAKQALIDAAFEFQREYTLDEKGNDLQPHAKDQGACTGGTFNKILEKLVSIHPFVQIDFMTTESAGEKLPYASREVATEYLANLDTKEYNDCLKTLKEDGILEPIWEKISSTVEKKMEDYAPLYTTKNFKEFIAAGSWSPVDDKFFLEVEKKRNEAKEVRYEKNDSSTSSSFFQPKASVDSSNSPPQSVGNSKTPGRDGS